MRTRITIGAIVGACVLAAAGVVVALYLVWGAWPGLVIAAGGAAAVYGTYAGLVRPWHSRWGATLEEVRREMPGDDLIPNAPTTTRAITIEATPREIWPWLVQIGLGRGGWYSYDWIDNDGKPSAGRILPEFQDLRAGDVIPMMPGFGPPVRVIERNRYLIAGDPASSTWCLALYPAGERRTRLVSRWRAGWKLTPATAFWILIAEPGAFIMEQKMLRGLKSRIEAAGARPEAA